MERCHDDDEVLEPHVDVDDDGDDEYHWDRVV